MPALRIHVDRELVMGPVTNLPQQVVGAAFFNAVFARVPEEIRRQWNAINRKYKREATREKHRALLIQARLCSHPGAQLHRAGWTYKGSRVVWECPLCKFKFVCS